MKMMMVLRKLKLEKEKDLHQLKQMTVLILRMMMKKMN